LRAKVDASLVPRSSEVQIASLVVCTLHFSSIVFFPFLLLLIALPSSSLRNMLAPDMRLLVFTLLLLLGEASSLPVDLDLNAIPVDSDHEVEHSTLPSAAHPSAIDQASSSLNAHSSGPSSTAPIRKGYKLRVNLKHAELGTLPHYEALVEEYHKKHGTGASTSSGASTPNLSYEAIDELMGVRRRLTNAITRTRGPKFAAVEARLRDLRSSLPTLKEQYDPEVAKEKARKRNYASNRRRTLRKKFGEQAAPKMVAGRKMKPDNVPPKLLKARQHRNDYSLRLKVKTMKRASGQNEVAGAASTSANPFPEVEQKPHPRAP
jgi:hypothetical protein